MTDETNAPAQADGEDTAAVMAALSGDKTYIGEPEGNEPEEQPEEDPGDDAAAAEAEGEGDEPKPKKPPRERINELTKNWRETERERDYWREQALRTQPAPAPAAAQPQADAGKPDPTTYTDGIYDPQYIEDLTDWKTEQAVTRRFAQHEQQSRVQSAIQTFDQKVEAEYPDGEPAGITALRRAPASLVTQALVDLITSSEVGPKLAEHLGDNPRELSRLSAIAPHLQGREIAKLEAKLAGPPVITPKTATDAPEPAPTLRGNGGRFKVAPDTQDFAAFEAQYKLGG